MQYRPKRFAVTSNAPDDSDTAYRSSRNTAAQALRDEDTKLLGVPADRRRSTTAFRAPLY